MKSHAILLLFSLVLGLSTGSATAKDFKFPKEEPFFSISVPDSWEPELDDEGTLEGEDKEGNAYLAVWEEDTETELSKVAEDIDELLAEYARDVKLTGQPEPIILSGMGGLVFKGTAKDKEDGSSIGFEAIVFAKDKDHAAVIYYDYSADASEAVVKQLVKILESIKPL